MGGQVARMGDKRNTCRILVGKPEGKRPLGRPRRRWEENIMRPKILSSLLGGTASNGKMMNMNKF
jgi:hypothetical protein